MAERAEVLVTEAEAAERELDSGSARAELRHSMDALGNTEAAFS